MYIIMIIIIIIIIIIFLRGTVANLIPSGQDDVILTSRQANHGLGFSSFLSSHMTQTSGQPADTFNILQQPGWPKMYNVSLHNNVETC